MIVAFPSLDFGAQQAEGLKLGVDAPAADAIATRAREDRAAVAMEQPGCNEKGTADGASQLAVRPTRRQLGGIDPKRRTALERRCANTQIREQLEQREYVADAGDVGEEGLARYTGNGLSRE